MPKEKKETKIHDAKATNVVERRSGKFIFANGDTYEGEYEHVKTSDGDDSQNSIERSGRGVLTCAANGTIYSGTWRNDKLDGPDGVFEHPASGCRYEGEFRDGVFHGHGVYSWPNGAIYEGEFDSGRMFGHGTFRDPNGQIWIGMFHVDSGDSTAKLKFRLNM